MPLPTHKCRRCSTYVTSASADQSTGAVKRCQPYRLQTVFDKLQNTFGLRRERPHCLGGFSARLAARVGLHNFCIYLNRLLGRPNLAFADLVDW